METRKENKFIFETIIAILVCFTCIATVIGTLFSFMNLKFNIVTIIIIMLMSIFMGYKIQNIFYISKNHKKTLFLLILILTGIYSMYSPVMEVRQDPAVYMLKSMNLINYGTTYSPNDSLRLLIEKGVVSASDYEGYAQILNGTKYLEQGLETDFYAGPAYVNATFGMLHKDISFYGSTLIAVLIGVIIFYLLIQKDVFNKHYKIAAIFTAIFMISPINTWFFRGTYSENISCLFFILSIFFLTKAKNIGKIEMIFLIILGIASYCVRLDYILLVLVITFILSYSRISKGAVASLIFIGIHYILKETYSIYYDRISINDFKVIKFAVPLIIMFFVCGCIFNKLKESEKLSVEDIIKNKFFNYFLLILICIIVILSFRNAFVLHGNYEKVFMDGAIRESFNEQIFNRFYMVFPSFVIMGGVIYLNKFFLQEELNINSKIIILGLFVPYCYYLYKSGNSPQMYFNLRRYIYIILPTIYLSFCCFVSTFNIRNLKYIVLFTSILMLHTQLESKQIIEFKGLDKSVQQFADKYGESDNVFLYESELKYDFSSIISYMKNECIPVDSLSSLEKIKEALPNKNLYYVSREAINSDSEKFSVDYNRMGENFDSLPKDKQIKELDMNITSVDSILNEEVSDNIVYPNRTVDYEGFYENGPWTDGNLNIYGTFQINEVDNYLILKRCNYKNPLADRDELEIGVYINNTKLNLEKVLQDGLTFYYKIPNNIKEISKINIKSNTFIPKDEGVNGDGRILGLDIESIRISE